MKASATAVALLMLLALSPVNADASSCIYVYKTLDEQVRSEFRVARFVFSGEVTQITKIPDKALSESFDRLNEQELADALSSLHRLLVTIRVDAAWRGDPANFIDLITMDSSVTDGGVPFVIGEKYLIFANDRKGQLVAGGCSLSRSFERSADVLEILGEGKAVEQGKPAH